MVMVARNSNNKRSMKRQENVSYWHQDEVRRATPERPLYLQEQSPDSKLSLNFR